MEMNTGLNGMLKVGQVQKEWDRDGTAADGAQQCDIVCGRRGGREGVHRLAGTYTITACLLSRLSAQLNYRGHKE